MLKVSTVKFELQDDLNELQARIYLGTKKKLSKKEILELTFNFSKNNFDRLISLILEEEQGELNDNDIKDILSLTSDLGKDTEKKLDFFDEDTKSWRKFMSDRMVVMNEGKIAYH